MTNIMKTELMEESSFKYIQKYKPRSKFSFLKLSWKLMKWNSNRLKQLFSYMYNVTFFHWANISQNLLFRVFVLIIRKK